MSIISSSSSHPGRHLQQNQITGNGRHRGRDRRRSQARRLSVVALAAAAVPFAVQQARADFTGFGDGSGFTTNGTAGFDAPVVGTNITSVLLTNANNGEAGSVWNNTAQNITNFTAQFSYNWVSGSFNTADGVAFVLQNDPTGTGALGGGGGGLGYSGVSNSAALQINIYRPHNRGIGNNINGGVGAPPDGSFLAIPGMEFASTNAVTTTVQYNGLILTETFSQGTNSFTTATMIDLTAPLGGGTALVGFTGATGGENAEQHISNVSFITGTNALQGLGVDRTYGGGENNFSSGAAWGGTAPSSGTNVDNALITSASGTVHVTTGAVIGNLQLEAGNTLSIENGANLLVSGPGGFQMATGTNAGTAVGSTTLNVSGGRLVIGGGSTVFGTGGGSAIVNVSGGLLAAQSTSRVFLGDGAGSVGHMTVSGGQVSLGQWLHIGNNGGEGHLNMTGGELDVARLQGGQDNGIGDFTMTGGVINVGGDSELGHSRPDTVSGGVPNFVANLSGGTFNVGGQLVIGAWHNGFGVMNVSNGANINSGDLLVGRDDGASTTGNMGILNITGGNLHVGGILNDSGDFIVGTGNALSSGTVNMSGGQLTVGLNQGRQRWIRDGFNGASSTFNMSGGTITLNGWFRIGETDGTNNNVFNMSGGHIALVTTDSRFMVGPAGTGVANFTGGVLDINGNGDALDLGDSGTFSHGIINQSGGTINVTNGGFVSIGNWGEGDATISHGLGTYNMSNGATLNASNMRLGHENNATANVGDGAFNQFGGVVNISNELHIGSEGVTQSGTYTMSGGTLSFGAASVGNGSGGGSFTATAGNISGGLLAVNSAGTVSISTGVTNTTTLFMNGGSASLSIGPVLRIGTGAAGSSDAHVGGIVIAPNGGTVLTTATSIQMKTGTLSVNGTNYTTNLPFNSISASNGSQVNLNPGTGNTFTTLAGSMNLNSSSLHAQQGLVDLSNIAVTTSGTNSFFSTGTFAGLKETWVANNTNNANINTTDYASPTQGSLQLKPRFGTTINTHSDALGDGVIDPVNKIWGNHVTVIYSGQMFVPAATPVVAFGEAFDDAVSVKIDGVEIMHDEVWNNSTSSGSNVLTPGFHNVEFRFGQGNGGAGPDGQGGWPGTMGFGLQLGTTASTFDAKNDGTGAAATATASLYTIPVDNGTGNLFRFIGTTFTQGADVTVDEGGELRVKSLNGTAPILINGASGGTVGATFTIPAAVALTTNTSGDVLVTATNSLGTMNLGANNTLNATNVTVPTGSTFTVNGPGKLNVSGTTSISDNAVMHFGTNATHVTHTTGSLVITTSTNTGGLLDLGNSFLITDNALTSEAQIRTYLHNGYNADASGIGNWLGKGGITSSDAIKSHNGPSPDFHVSVGYVNGAYALDPLIGGSIPGQESLPTNRTLIRPALYGDLNLDGKVDDTDLQIFSGLGQYNQPTDKFGWLGGDLNHDGKVDDTDLQIFSGAGNYNGPTYGAAGGASHASATPSATPSLTGHVEANGDIILSASTTQGVAGDGVLDFVYNPANGHLMLSYDGDPRVTSAQPFQVVRFKSAGSRFIPANFNGAAFGAGVTATTAALNGTASGSNSVPDGYDMGAVLPTGLAVSDLTSDLTLQWNVFGGGLTLKNGDVIVPEPAAIGLLGIGAIGLLARRRKHKRETADAS